MIDGLPADMVALALPLDVDKIVDAGLIRPTWPRAYPNNSVGEAWAGRGGLGVPRRTASNKRNTAASGQASGTLGGGAKERLLVGFAQAVCPNQRMCA